MSCHFFAESATSDEAELVAFLGKLSDLGRPGATLLTSFICRSAGYTIHERDFPAFAVDESSIFAYLDRAGVELEDVGVRSVASEDLASDPDYEGLLFVAGRLPGYRCEPTERKSCEECVKDRTSSADSMRVTCLSPGGARW